MQIDSQGKPKPYQTKAERIQQLEEALEAIAQADSIEEARRIVSSARRTDGRWRKPSPLSHAELMKAAEQIEGTQDKPQGTTSGD